MAAVVAATVLLKRRKTQSELETFKTPVPSPNGDDDVLFTDRTIAATNTTVAKMDVII